jgi:hypothetical protein
MAGRSAVASLSSLTPGMLSDPASTWIAPEQLEPHGLMAHEVPPEGAPKMAGATLTAQRDVEPEVHDVVC